MLNMAMASFDKPLWRVYFKVGVKAWKLTGRGPGDRLWEDMKRKLEVLEMRMGEWERNGCQFSPKGKGQSRKGKGDKAREVISQCGKDESTPETTE
jgi:hypothetical protein